MNDKYDSCYDTIVFLIAGLMFGEPTTETQIRLVDGWARQRHIYEQIHSLDDNCKDPSGTTPTEQPDRRGGVR